MSHLVCHPTPGLRRDSFLSLDGVWAVSQNGASPVSITVPYPPESSLSGAKSPPVGRASLHYRKAFSLPAGFLTGGRLLLHIGAADQYLEVRLNGTLVPTTKGESVAVGAYRANVYDLTEAILPDEENLLEVAVTDNLRDGVIPYGKQRVKRGGMWYTPISGIWQSVWLEAVPEVYVRALRVDSQIAPDRASALVRITAEGVDGGTVHITTPDGMLDIPLSGGVAEAVISNPRLWSPDAPYLYEFTVEAGEVGGTRDRVASYFALRTLTVETVGGIPRLCLNGRPYFFHALLDQGYFPEGILTPDAPDAYERDIQVARSLGFNTLRKHIKVEPERFYYDCDRLGMLVFQDMVNNGRYSFLRDTALPTVGLKSRSDKRMHPNKAARAAFLAAMEATVEALRHHPCICLWTIFNEGWGQFDSEAVYRGLRELDSTRFIDTASGWFKGGESDVDSEHIYFKPVSLRFGSRPMILSEFGGYACRIEGHAPAASYGYRFFDSPAALEDAIIRLYEEEILPAIPHGLCAAVYTQLTDVEDEVNGLITYDREAIKVDAERMRELAMRLEAAMGQA